MNLFKFIGPKNLSVAWKEQYEGVIFWMPLQADVDIVVLDAQKQVLSGSPTNLSVALAPPRGRPVQNTGNGCAYGMNPGLRLGNAPKAVLCTT